MVLLGPLDGLHYVFEPAAVMGRGRLGLMVRVRVRVRIKSRLSYIFFANNTTWRFPLTTPNNLLKKNVYLVRFTEQ